MSQTDANNQKNLRLKWIGCEVFFRMASRIAATSPHTIDMTFTTLQSHAIAKELHEKIQAAIDGCDPKTYDAILLGYGLCGNATAGLKASGIPLVIPRAHDCCALFLGSRQKFKEHFEHRLSAKWSSHGYLERTDDYLGGTQLGESLGFDKQYQEFVEEYGEEDAAYLWETLHPQKFNKEKIYIEVEPFEQLHFYERFIEKLKADDIFKADEPNHVFFEDTTIEILQGSDTIIHKLLWGEWDEDFLVVKPGEEIKPDYSLMGVFA
ncbi:MAG: DUF1638 domain-containing protein [Erysipelotrichaceae bacterium]|jgi:hypothetical protein|nr:DUF1638 domain-containing protein [Erysipelotrichaceae bacterium]